MSAAALSRLRPLRPALRRLSGAPAPSGRGRPDLVASLLACASHPHNNVPPVIIDTISRRDRGLHLIPGHPLCTIRTIIADYWNHTYPSRSALGPCAFTCEDDLSPLVTARQCFDDLLVPAEHECRSKGDTYWADDGRVLRTHTSAHQSELLRRGADAFLVAGDVYRRDEVDRSHYPIFHQMEGVRVCGRAAGIGEAAVVADLRAGLEGMAGALFPGAATRWVDAYFPFTAPSLELEVWYGGEWLEVLGCGRVRPEILAGAGRGGDTAWAFGLGLERLAMVLYDVPDIRLFWSEDPRFTDQFTAGEVTQFVPYSKYSPVLKDISFWTDKGAGDGAAGAPYHLNDFNEAVRGVAGDLVEQVELTDSFVHPKTQRVSHCYRLTYRSMDRNLTNAEIDEIQAELRVYIGRHLDVELR